MNMKGKIIVIEGIDGAGKTSVACRLKSLHPKLLVIKGCGSGNILGWLAKKANLTALYDAEALFISYFALLQQLSGRIVVLDRSILTPLTFRKQKLERLLLALYPKPDLLIYLEASDRCIRGRLARKPYNPYHQMLITNQPALLARKRLYEQIYRIAKTRKIRIATTNATVEGVAARVWGQIRQSS